MCIRDRVVIVPLMAQLTGKNGNTMLTASILLAVMILPTVVGVTESAITSVPESYYEASLGLGATHSQSVFFAVVPAAKSGILAGIVLGIGRAIGETMAVIMIAGNQPRMPDVYKRQDLEKHEFDLCEECYDRITLSFAVPPEISEDTEV